MENNKTCKETTKRYLTSLFKNVSPSAITTIPRTRLTEFNGIQDKPVSMNVIKYIFLKNDLGLLIIHESI